jgi:hypothetical protein
MIDLVLSVQIFIKVLSIIFVNLIINSKFQVITLKIILFDSKN